MKLPARIRICKGAYNEPPEVAFPEKRDVDANYIKVMQVLLSSGIYHGIATHDPKMIDATIRICHARRDRQGEVRVSDALRHPARSPASARPGRLQRAESMFLTGNTGILTSCAGWLSALRISGLY